MKPAQPTLYVTPSPCVHVHMTTVRVLFNERCYHSCPSLQCISHTAAVRISHSSCAYLTQQLCISHTAAMHISHSSCAYLTQQLCISHTAAVRISHSSCAYLTQQLCVQQLCVSHTAAVRISHSSCAYLLRVSEGSTGI